MTTKAEARVGEIVVAAMRAIAARGDRAIVFVTQGRRVESDLAPVVARGIDDVRFAEAVLVLSANGSSIVVAKNNHGRPEAIPLDEQS